MVYVISYFVSGIIFGFVTKTINENKGYEGGFAWGFFLGILGVIVVACKPENRSESQKNVGSISIRESDISVSESYIEERIRTANQLFSDGNYDSAKKAYQSILQYYSHYLGNKTFNEIDAQIQKCSEYLNCSLDKDREYAGKIKCSYCGAYNNEMNSVCFSCNKSLQKSNESLVESQTQNGSKGEPIALIKELAELHSQGILTDEEFETKKAELLARM